jgi:hypothetical protein
MIKPQLLLQEFKTEGINNGAPGKTVSRLKESASWKRQRIVVLIPSGSSIPVKVYLSHLNLGFPPNNGVARIAAVGMEVGEAYSQAIEQILLHPELSQWEYILTIESMERTKHKYACIGGLYFTKGYGGQPQIWGDPRDPVLNFRPQVPDVNGGLVECNGTGMGFNLWQLKMFKDKKLRKPWFVTQKVNGMATQDLYAWSDFNKHGYRCAIDCSVKVGHLDIENDIVW